MGKVLAGNRGAPSRRYAPGGEYEQKLHRVMRRLGVKEYQFDYSRFEAWVQLTYKGSLYRFEHTVARAQARGQKISYGSDCFAQIVLSLEDLSRMIERGIYDLQTWIAGMKSLPPATEIPTFFRVLGFHEIPENAGEVKSRYRALVKEVHPDRGGDRKDLDMLLEAKEKALRWFEAARQTAGG